MTSWKYVAQLDENLKKYGSTGARDTVITGNRGLNGIAYVQTVVLCGW